MAFGRTGADPLIRIIFFVVGLVAWLVASVLRKVTSSLPKKEQRNPPLPSFLFSELKGPPPPSVRTIYTKIRGVSFGDSHGTSRQQIIRRYCHPGDALLLMREPGNRVDTNAIGVVRVCRGHDGRATFTELLGHLSKEIAGDLAPFFDEGPVGFAEILEVTGDPARQDNCCIGVNIRADIYMPDKSGGRRKDTDSVRPRKRKRVV
jgi:HIRAN domain